MKKSIVAVAATALLLSGCATGASSQPSVPQACLDALDDADHLISVSAELTDIMVDIIDAVIAFDVDAVDQTDRIDALTREVERSTYAKNRNKCWGQS